MNNIAKIAGADQSDNISEIKGVALGSNFPVPPPSHLEKDAAGAAPAAGAAAEGASAGATTKGTALIAEEAWAATAPRSRFRLAMISRKQIL